MLAKKILHSFWVERMIFIIGCVIVFFGNFIFSTPLTTAEADIKYYERNIQQVQIANRSREVSLLDYNRAVSAAPFDNEWIGHSAYTLYSDTDRLLTLLRGVVEEQGRHDIGKLIEQKNTRIKSAEQELLSGQYEKLVSKLNAAQEDYDKNAAPLTAQMMLLLVQANNEELKWSKIVSSAQIFGTLLLGLAFLLREFRDFRMRKTNSTSV